MNAASALPDKLHSLNRFFWFTLPVKVRPRLPALSLILTNGIYASAVPSLGGVLPLLTLLTGLFAGYYFLPPGGEFSIYSSNLTLMLLLVAVSSLGASLGFWLFLGYVLDDLFVLRMMRVAGTDLQFGKHGSADLACVVILYGLLAALLVFVPFVSHALSRLTVALPGDLWDLLRKATSKRTGEPPKFMLSAESKWAGVKPATKRWLRCPFDVALYAGCTGLLVYFWTQTTPVLLRSAYIWYAPSPQQFGGLSTHLISILQNDYTPIVQTGVLFGAIRIVLEYVASGRAAFLKDVRKLRADLQAVEVKRGKRDLAWGWEIGRALLMLLFLYGLLTVPLYVVVTAFLLLFSMFVRKGLPARWRDRLATVPPLLRLMGLLGRLSAWREWVTSIPLILRLVLAVAGTYHLSIAILEDKMSSRDFYPVLLAFWLSLTLAAFLFPERISEQAPLQAPPVSEPAKGESAP